MKPFAAVLGAVVSLFTLAIVAITAVVLAAKYAVWLMEVMK